MARSSRCRRGGRIQGEPGMHNARCTMQNAQDTMHNAARCTQCRCTMNEMRQCHRAWCSRRRSSRPRRTATA
jgi:hypothetical protein